MLIQGHHYVVNDRLLDYPTSSYQWWLEEEKRPFHLKVGTRVRVVLLEDHEIHFQVHAFNKYLNCTKDKPFCLSRLLAEAWLTDSNLCAECDAPCEGDDYLCASCR